MPWYTIKDGFDADFGVDEWHGTNAFIRDGAKVFRPTSSTTAATSRWGALGTISTSLRSGARRSGRTRQRVTPRPRRTSGGTGRTTTTPRPRLTRSGSRCPTLEKPPSKSATQGRKRAKEGRPLRRLRAAGPFCTGAARVFRRICGTSPTEYRYEVLR